MRLLCPVCGWDYTALDSYSIECGEVLNGIPTDEDYDDACTIADSEYDARNEEW